jgi:putative restriction endonuclease
MLARRTPAQGRIFRERIPWTAIAQGLHAFVERWEAHVGIESARRLQRQAEEAFHQSSNPNETEVREMAKRRIGQDIFRRLLLEYWNRRCPISGINDPRLLRASHIKPWADCDNRERLDPFNGILLSANLDAAFDAGIISFSDDGDVLRSHSIDDANFVALGIRSGTRLPVTPEHAQFLMWHRRAHGYGSE